VLAHKELAGKLDQLERKVGSHDEAIKQLRRPAGWFGWLSLKESLESRGSPEFC
jgi:hypothetical protein